MGLQIGGRTLASAVLLGLGSYCLGAAADESPPTESPQILLTVPYSSSVGSTFQMSVSIRPSAKIPVTVEFDTDNISYGDNAKVTIPPGQTMSLSPKIAKPTPDGLAWVHAIANGYPDAFLAINLGFIGHLRLNTLHKIPYGRPSTLTLSLVDKDGKPFGGAAIYDIKLASTDAKINQSPDNQPTSIELLANASVSDQFQITPRTFTGGDVYLNTSLLTGDAILDAQSIAIPVEPAWWLPILLAIGGGLLYGIYKSLNLLQSPSGAKAWSIVALIIGSMLAGFLGYLIANLDLLGIKLDPDVLRSYPLLGFLVAYIGVDALGRKISPSP